MTLSPEKINDNISLYQNPTSLAFGTDAYLLSAYLGKGIKNSCELGAGSGVITLLAAARGKIKNGVCVEIQENIAELCRKNISENGFGDRISAISADIRELPSEMFGAFDAVFSNPPYMKATSGKMNVDKADAACRHELFGTIDDFCQSASRLLKFGGDFYAVYRPDRLAELIVGCEKNDLRIKLLTLVYPTDSHTPSIVLVKAKKGANHGMKTTKPLIIYGSRDNMTNDGFTPDMKYIYENGDFHESFR